MKTIEKKAYSLTYDSATGRITGLYDSKNASANWIAQGTEMYFGVPFFNGVQWTENHLSCQIEEESREGLALRSGSGNTEVRWNFGEEQLEMQMKVPLECGPRAGMEMDFNFLDLQNGTDWRYQCMPKMIDVDESLQYAFFVFCTGDDRYLALTVDSPFTAFRIKYDYSGHRMVGFQLLTQADDVVTGERPALRPVNYLSFRIVFGDSSQDCLEKIAEALGICIAMTAVSGGFPGTQLQVGFIGERESLLVQRPDGEEAAYTGNLLLEQEGIYQLKTISSLGRQHISRVLCHSEWEQIYDKVNRFYRDYFQDPCGAFYRIIWSDSLKPEDSVNYEGTAFGSPGKIGSCRSGEFGGFAAWAMIKNQLLFGEKAEFSESVRKYIENWALNRGHEDTPYCSTICKRPQTFLERSYGSYHLYQEVNYPQHEIFFMEELADYYKFSKEEGILKDAVRLAEHFMAEHMQDDGMVICENHPGRAVDYSTVHSEICGFIRLSELLREKDREKSLVFLRQAEKIADHVCRRGLHFPTEGEPCTEDGSMACSVITLLWAYLKVKPKAEYLKTAEEILWYHRMLVMDGADCRMRNSSLRFWETQYETRDWGPSINAGHAWTIWSAEALALLALIKRDILMLRDSYEGFITNICKVRENGGMPCCYTPDMIPGSPHAPCVWGVDTVSDDNSDIRPTTTHLGMDMVQKTYAASGNYFLIKAAELWGHISGVWLAEQVGINGIYRNHIFESKAPDFDELLISALPQERMIIRCFPGKSLTLHCPETMEQLMILNADIVYRENNKIIFVPLEDEVELKRNERCRI